MMDGPMRAQASRPKDVSGLTNSRASTEAMHKRSKCTASTQSDTNESRPTSESSDQAADDDEKANASARPKAAKGQ